MIFKALIDLAEDERDQILNRSLKIDVTLVKDILDDVRARGDEALKEYTEKYDSISINDFKVSDEEFNEARRNADPGIIRSIERAHENILGFHKKQLEKEFFYEDSGRNLGLIIRPVERVGCYVPGGRAFYPSTVLMAAVPARVAGVERIACATPPRKDGKISPITLIACIIAGVKEVYKVGGAQAIAALAYGTKTIPKVDMIVGPGNIYVTAAKKAVYGEVGIDMLAGPSEVLILADSTGKSDFIVSDILAQAEHDPNASCVLLTTSKNLAHETKDKLKALIKAPAGVVNTAILMVENMEEAVNFANKYAPEHLEIMSVEHESILEKVKNAGSIFIGNYSPVAAGDYASGPNHILPTGGCAAFQSGLSVGHFLKKISVQKLSKKGLRNLKPDITALAEAEGLKHHSESVQKRF
jgi:histidinol dehydrogenase